MKITSPSRVHVLTALTQLRGMFHSPLSSIRTLPPVGRCTLNTAKVEEQAESAATTTAALKKSSSKKNPVPNRRSQQLQEAAAASTALAAGEMLETKAFNGDNIQGLLQGGRFVIRLTGLVGLCKQFNGTAVLPEKCKDGGGSYTVDVGEKIQMVVTSDRLMVEADPDFLQKRVKETKSNVASGNNRASVKLAMGSMLTSIRRELTARMAESNETINDVFAKYDTDGSGDLDLYEFEDTLQSLGLRPRTDEIEMVFKSLDTDKSGGLSIDEFIPLLTESSNTFVRDNGTLLGMLTRERRASRISAASMQLAVAKLEILATTADGSNANGSKADGSSRGGSGPPYHHNKKNGGLGLGGRLVRT